MLIREIASPRMLIASGIRANFGDVPEQRMTKISAIAAGIIRPAATGEMGDDAGPRTVVPALTNRVSIKK